MPSLLLHLGNLSGKRTENGQRSQWVVAKIVRKTQIVPNCTDTSCTDIWSELSSLCEGYTASRRHRWSQESERRMKCCQEIWRNQECYFSKSWKSFVMFCAKRIYMRKWRGTTGFLQVDKGETFKFSIVTLYSSYQAFGWVRFVICARIWNWIFCNFIF